MTAPDRPKLRRSKRRRLESSQSHVSGEGTTDRGIWLDKLPEDVRIRLATHVCHGEHNADALALAKASSVQRNAVLTVLGNCLVVYHKTYSISQRWPVGGRRKRNWDSATIREWISLMGEDIFALDQTFLIKIPRATPSFILSAMSLPRLRVAQIIDRPAQIAAIASSSSIEEVTVLVHRGMHNKKMFEALSRLRLTKLRIFCLPWLRAARWVPSNNFCPFNDPEVNCSESDPIGTHFPHLTSIDISCNCNLLGPSRVWDFLLSFKPLAEVSFRWSLEVGEIAEEALRFLASCDSVRVVDSFNATRIASLIGTSVTHVSETRVGAGLVRLTREEVFDLQRYPQLTELAIQIKAGAETALPTVLEKLPNLKMLEVCWNPNAERREPCKYTGCTFPTAVPGMMLRAVQVASQLKTLSLVDVRIALSELLCIMKSMGGWLVALETSLGDQKEAPFERLEALLIGAAAHNTGLREFVVDVKHNRGPLSVKEWKEQADRVRTGLVFLEKRAPEVSLGDIELDMDSMIREM